MFNSVDTVLNSANLPNVPVMSGFEISWLVNIAINLLIGVTFSVSIAVIAWAGLQYIQSNGDPKNAAKAWQTFLWGTMAAIIAISVLALKVIFYRLIGARATSSSEERIVDF